MFWKVAWAGDNGSGGNSGNSGTSDSHTQGGGGSKRILECRKESLDLPIYPDNSIDTSTNIDVGKGKGKGKGESSATSAEASNSTQVWTGTFMDPRQPHPKHLSDLEKHLSVHTPQNALTGQLYIVNAYRNDSLEVPLGLSHHRFWRYTAAASMTNYVYGRSSGVGVQDYEKSEKSEKTEKTEKTERRHLRLRRQRNAQTQTSSTKDLSYPSRLSDEKHEAAGVLGLGWGLGLDPRRHRHRHRHLASRKLKMSRHRQNQLRLQKQGAYITAPGILGYEWDILSTDKYRPAGTVALSSTTRAAHRQIMGGYGATYV